MATILNSDVTAPEIAVAFFDGSSAMGALLHYMCNTINGELVSDILILDRNMSQNFKLPFNPCFGQYQIFFYDIESDGLLSDVCYSAAELDVSGNYRASECKLATAQSSN